MDLGTKARHHVEAAALGSLRHMNRAALSHTLTAALDGNTHPTLLASPILIFDHCRVHIVKVAIRFPFETFGLETDRNTVLGFGTSCRAVDQSRLLRMT